MLADKKTPQHPAPTLRNISLEAMEAMEIVHIIQTRSPPGQGNNLVTFCQKERDDVTDDGVTVDILSTLILLTMDVTRTHVDHVLSMYHSHVRNKLIGTEGLGPETG